MSPPLTSWAHAHGMNFKIKGNKGYIVKKISKFCYIQEPTAPVFENLLYFVKRSSQRIFIIEFIIIFALFVFVFVF